MTFSARNSIVVISLLVLLCCISASAQYQWHEPPWMPSENTSHRHAEVIGIPIGEMATVAELEGPAMIHHIWITVKCVIPQVHGMLVLRVWWDDEETPSIEVPLGDFFGVGFGKERLFKSAMLEMHPAGGEHHASLNTYWKMPFRKSARFEVENRSYRSITMFFIQIDYEKFNSLPEDVLYFHAQYRRENPVTKGVPYTILEAEGRGNYVGTILNYHLLGPGAWVEGGQSFYIDGEETPSLPGTGGEDYFGHAWGFRFEDHAPFHGTSFGPEDNKMTAYRFHIPDPVRFQKSIRATMQCHGWDVKDREDDYSSVALWYQSEPHAPFPELPPVDFDYLEVEEQYRRNPLDLIQEVMKTLPFSGENLALGTVDWRASGHYDIDGYGNMAFDGDVGTKWTEIDNPDAHWLAMDLGQLSEIEGFVILSPSAVGESADYDILAFHIEKGESLDGDWERIVARDFTFPSADKPEPSGGIVFVPLEQPVTTRFIRLNITKSCAVDPTCRVQEFEVWGRRLD